VKDRQEIAKAGHEHDWFSQHSNRLQIFTKEIHGGTIIDEHTSTDFKRIMLVVSWEWTADRVYGGGSWDYFINADLFENGIWMAGTTDSVVARNWLVDK
jgi:hypothetical protein